VLKEHVSGNPQAWLTSFQCSPYHQNSAFYPIIDTLERVVLQFSRNDALQDRQAKLEGFLVQYGLSLPETLPLFAALLSLPLPERYAPLNLTPERQKQETRAVLLTILLKRAAKQPLLLLVEDLHWIDPSTLELLSLIVDQGPTTGILAVFTCRPDFESPWTARSHLTQVTLNRLTRKQVADMVDRVAGGKILPAELIEQIAVKTDGVPLFVEELTKMVLESGLLEDHEDHYELSEPLPALAIPTTLHDSLMARLDRLATVKDVAQLAATLGREFTFELLKAVSPLEEKILDRELSQLVQAGLLYQQGVPPQATFIFKHALIQDAAYQSLLKSKRQQYHARIAKVLVERFPAVAETEPELVAHHLTEAELTTQATEWWERAGKLAVQRSANFEAVNHFNKGLDVLARDPATQKRDERELELRTRLCMPLYVTTGYASPQTEANYARMELLSERLGASAKLLRVWWGQAAMTLVRAELRTTLVKMQRFMDLAKHAGDANAMIAGHRVLQYVHLARGDLRISRAELEQAIKAYDRRMEDSFIATYDMSPVPCATCILFLAVQQLGYLDQAASLINQAIGDAKQSRHPPTLAYVLFSVALFWMIGGDATRVRQVTDELLALIQTNDIRLYNSYCDVLVGWTTAKSGDLEGGLRLMRRGAAARKAVQANLWVPVHLTREAELLNEHRRIDEALEVLHRAEASIEETEQRYAAAELYRLRAVTLVGMHAAPAEIEKTFQQALETAQQQEAKLWELRAAVSYAEYLRNYGRVREARALLEPVYEWFTEGLDTGALETAKRMLETLTPNALAGTQANGRRVAAHDR
jgi:predicted ATPase